MFATTLSTRIGGTAAFVALLVGGALVSDMGIAQAHTERVDCEQQDLQPVLDAAPLRARLRVSGICTGNFVIDKDVTIVGTPGATMQGGGGTSLTIVQDAHVELHDVVVTGGLGNVWGHPLPPKTGGIDNFGTLLLTGTTSVTQNSSYYNVGGIANFGTLLMRDNSTVNDNHSQGVGGVANLGIMFMHDWASVTDNSQTGVHNEGSLTMNDRSTVSNNRDRHFSGVAGGISNEGTLTLNDRASVVGNVAQQLGGGIDNGGTVHLNDRSSVSSNEAYTGAGIYNHWRGVIVATNRTQISGNSARNLGGAVYNDSGGVVEMRDRAQIRHNTATNGGGGIYNDEGTVTIGQRAKVTDNIPDDCTGC